MDRLHQLIREIHRRSLWQVLSIYLVGGWMAYEVVQGLTQGLGLPDWFPPFAVVLLIIGLPIVLATAFVQEGPVLSAVLLFLSGGLILPSESRQALEGLDHFFERDGKLALVPLVLFLLASIPYNILGGLPVVATDNLVLLCLVALGAITFFFPGRLRGASTVAFTVLTTYAFFFIWARPGVS